MPRGYRDQGALVDIGIDGATEQRLHDYLDGIERLLGT